MIFCVLLQKTSFEEGMFVQRPQLPSGTHQIFPRILPNPLQTKCHFIPRSKQEYPYASLAHLDICLRSLSFVARLRGCRNSLVVIE
jgi:hypothetical protein